MENLIEPDSKNEFGVLILSERDKKEFDYILKTRGADWVKYAVSHLIGNRKPYVSNLAKIMKLDIPPDLPDKGNTLAIDEGLARLSKVIRLRKKP